MELSAPATGNRRSAALAVAAGPTVSAGPAAPRIKGIVDVATDDLPVVKMLVAMGTMAAAEVPAARVAVRAGGCAGDGWYNRPS
jgi:hypothetical protein